jgi:undecaprenyl pyrophosphate phosphatase UppP
LTAVSGILLYIPQFFRRGNKNADTVSGLDGLLIGISGAVAAIPGFSGLAGMLCTASLRGVDRQFSASNGLMLFLGILPVLAVYELISLVLTGGALVTAYWLLLYFLSAVSAFAGAWLAVQLVSFLAVRVGFSGFAYYCWGQAIFTFALYLMI